MKHILLLLFPAMMWGQSGNLGITTGESKFVVYDPDSTILEQSDIFYYDSTGMGTLVFNESISMAVTVPDEVIFIEDYSTQETLLHLYDKYYEQLTPDTVYVYDACDTGPIVTGKQPY